MSMAKQYTMTVSLTKQLDAYVKAKVKSGEYASASEVMRESLRYTQEREVERAIALRALDRKLAAGIDALETGKHADGEEVFEDVLRELARSTRGVRKSRPNQGRA